jgi:biopolymer transport protein TolR
MHIRSRTALESNINVTPLVDVCLVLLIIFMVVTPTIVNGIAVKLPEVKGDPSGKLDEQLAITVKDDRTVYLGALAIRSEQLATELKRLHAASPNRPVAVRGDKTVPYGDVASVLDACRSAGFSDVRLITAKRD